MSTDIPAAQRIDPRIRRTRQMLFQSFHALLGEKAFDLITVQDITEHSTLNRATFYDHFTDKYALLEAMIAERFRNYIATRLGDPPPVACDKRLRALILAACDFLSEIAAGCKRNQRQFEPIVESQVKAIIREFLMPALLRHGVAQPDLQATMMSWAIAGAALEWSKTPEPRPVTPEVLAESILPAVCHVITAVKA